MVIMAGGGGAESLGRMSRKTAGGVRVAGYLQRDSGGPRKVLHGEKDWQEKES